MYFKSHAKCNSVDDMAEIFNGFIIDARYMLIVFMLKTIFHSVKGL